jgi:cyclopropane-fatty-acyl-phospholipid synthase
VWGLAFKVVDKVTLPEPLLRLGVRHFCQNRLNSLVSRGDGTFSEQVSRNIRNYARELRTLPLAVSTDLANEQHYEVPASFFDLVLGPNKKYSCCYWDKSTKSLGEAEELALDITIKRAELNDGQRILELGCGWGSLSLKMAKTFPRAKIVGVSNSIEQREYILKKAQSLGIKNLEIKTLDLSQVTSLEELVGTVDRVVSIEMFEHFRNYEKLLGLIRGALVQGGRN